MAVVKVPMVEVEVILLIMAQVVTIIIKVMSIGHHFHIFLLTQSDIMTSFQDLGQAGIIKAMDQVVILSFSQVVPPLNPFKL